MQEEGGAIYCYRRLTEGKGWEKALRFYRFTLLSSTLFSNWLLVSLWPPFSPCFSARRLPHPISPYSLSLASWVGEWGKGEAKDQALMRWSLEKSQMLDFLALRKGRTLSAGACPAGHGAACMSHCPRAVPTSLLTITIPLESCMGSSECFPLKQLVPCPWAGESEWSIRALQAAASHLPPPEGFCLKLWNWWLGCLVGWF